MNTTQDFKKGDRVYFGRRHGEQTLGEVVKVNRAKLKVKQLDGRGTYRAYPVGTVWTVPPSLCTKANAGSTASTVRAGILADEAARKAARPKRSEAEIMSEIDRIYSSLSPENLCCDGELSMTAVRRRAAALRSQLKDCFEELGRQVSDSEACAYARQHRPGVGA